MSKKHNFQIQDVVGKSGIDNLTNSGVNDNIENGFAGLITGKAYKHEAELATNTGNNSLLLSQSTNSQISLNLEASRAMIEGSLKKGIELGSDGGFEIRARKRGRPRKNCVLPLVRVRTDFNPQQDAPTHASTETFTFGLSTCSTESRDVNNELNSTKSRHDNERTCPICGKYYWKPSDLQRHLFKHTGERRFSCPICDQFFSCKRNMQYHQKAVHGLDIELSPGLDKKWQKRSYYFRAMEALKAIGGIQPKSNSSETNGELNGDQPLIPPEIDEQYAHIRWPKMNAETEDESSNCDVLVSVEDCDGSDSKEFKIDTMTEENVISRSIGINMATGESTIVYKCHLCDKMYINVDKLYAHFSEHLETLRPRETFVCDVCGELFYTDNELKAHETCHPCAEDENYDQENVISEDDDSEKSDGHDDMPSLLSPETLSDMAHASLALPVLEEGTSSGVADDEECRPGDFKCEVCSKTFDRSFSLNRHYRSHTGVKKCYCPHCSRGFCEQRNLRHHIIRFHSDGSERHLLKRNRKRNYIRKLRGRRRIRKEPVFDEMNVDEVKEHQIEPLETQEVPEYSEPLSSESSIEIRPENIDVKKEIKDNDGFQDRNDCALSENVADNVRQLLLSSNDNIVKHDNVNTLEDGLSECLKKGEKEEIVIKVELPSYINEPIEPETPETEQHSSLLLQAFSLPILPPPPPATVSLLPPPVSPLPSPQLTSELPMYLEPPPALPPVQPMLVVAGNSPRRFAKTMRVRRRRRYEMYDEEKDNADTGIEGESPPTEENDELSHQVNKKGSHISKYTPRLNIINKPERVKVILPRKMENGLIVFPCSYCDKVFTSSSDVHRHMNFHEDIRPYKCNQCNYCSRTTSQLKVHMMRHNGIKKYFCEPCNYYGVTQSDVNRHKKSQAHFARLAESTDADIASSSNCY